MNDYITNRVVQVAKYMLATNCTIRQAGKEYHLSKSTVHKDMQTRLYYIDIRLWGQVQQVLNHNLAVRHLRGGEATRIKYQQSWNCLQ